MSVARQNTDYACCVGETQGLIASVLQYVYISFCQNSFPVESYSNVIHFSCTHTHTHTNAYSYKHIVKRPLAHSSSSHSQYSSLIAYPKELQQCHDDLKRARADLDEQKGELDEKREELQALKKASGEKEAELLSEIRRLKQQSQKDKAELEKALEKAKEVNVQKRSDHLKHI